MLKKTGDDMGLKRIFFISFMVLVAVPAIGFCFDVTAHVDKTRISQEDSIFLQIEVAGGEADLDLSMIKSFKVMSRGTSSSYNYINGKSERKATYNFILIPLGKGTLTIPAIKAVRGSDIAFTREITVHVSNATVTPDDGKALFAISEVSDAHIFVGQQAVYTLKFYFSKRLSGLGFEKPPEFNGFSSKSFEKEKSYTQNIKGIRYQVTQVNYIIIPESPGNFTVDPAVLVANVMVKSKRDSRLDSFFNDSFFSSNSYKPVRVVSNPVNIEVSKVPPFPDSGQDMGVYSGLVGQFDIHGNIDQTNLKAGESATLTIKISGKGNIMDASLPEMDLNHDAFKVYDDNPIETIHLTEAGYEGFKIFKKAIVPVNPGTYVINPIRLTYFDVNQKKYQTVSTDKVRLDVTPSEEVHQAGNSINSTSDKTIVKQEVSLVNKDILEIKEGLFVLKDHREVNPFLFVLLLSIPAILFSGVKLFTLVARKDMPVERQMEEKAKLHLKLAREMGNQDKGFLGHLYSALVSLIFAKAKKKGETITLSEAKTILKDANVDDTQIDQITRLLEAIESVRFGGKLIDEKRATQLLLKTKQVMKHLCFAFLCMGLFYFVPQKASADATATFIDGIKNYKVGNFKQAAFEFETVAKSPVKNPYLFYNIANAYLKANDIGRAILWYERAKVLAPNDPDLNFNLAYANTLVKDKKEDAMNIMDILFFWDSLISAKIIQIFAIFLSFVFFSWAAINVVKKQKVFSGVGIILCSIFVLVTVIAGVSYYKRSVHLNAVILQNEVAVRSGMTDTATKLFSLHAGTRVSVEEQRDGYLKIEFSKGKIGWVKATDAQII